MFKPLIKDSHIDKPNLYFDDDLNPEFKKIYNNLRKQLRRYKQIL